MHNALSLRAARKAEADARLARIQRAQAETRRIVAGGACPDCGAGIRRNASLTGWYQCAQFGAVGFRADATKPPCAWQGFTE